MGQVQATLTGVVLALSVGLFATGVGLDRDRAFYPVVAIVVASYYALFAAMGASTHVLVLECVAGAVFVAAAVAGFRWSLWVAALALAAAAPLAVTSVQAQQSETQAAEPTTTAIGLPIFTSDGEHLGEVVQIISYGDKPALRAEIGSFLGLGATTAVIPANMFERKPDRIELTMTAAEVRDTVAKQK